MTATIRRRSPTSNGSPLSPCLRSQPRESGYSTDVQAQRERKSVLESVSIGQLAGKTGLRLRCKPQSSRPASSPSKDQWAPTLSPVAVYRSLPTVVRPDTWRERNESIEQASGHCRSPSQLALTGRIVADGRKTRHRATTRPSLEGYAQLLTRVYGNPAARACNAPCVIAVRYAS